jgi:hypothetical protein
MNDSLKIQKELQELKTSSVTAASSCAITAAQSYIKQGDLQKAQRIVEGLTRVNAATLHHNAANAAQHAATIKSGAFRYR